ncbi:matrix metalloproteinase-2-like [Daktulosphaira vitifoliae]|uniref:matrix metalloproteinase-2-like n=1 Tax=Daktulosphaira vitifoliae TaxID=58002 RepID=UPI0021AADAC6|nr:matrix metalloproteinase-2-like [Daktulosphaira vitifoliae]
MPTSRTSFKLVPFKSPLTVFLSLLVVGNVFDITTSRPASGHHKKREIRSAPVYEDVQGYLTKFGYLPESDLETGNLRTEDQLHDALRTLQRFGNIPVTGQMDAATKELMRKPRCGLPDETSNIGNRKKRYTLHGQKWQHVNLTWSLRTRHLDRMDHGWARSDLHKALQVWSKHSKLTFREVNSESADILVFFEKGFHGDGYPFDGPGQVLAHAFFPGAGRGGDAHFDVDEEWLLNGKESPEGTSLFTVAAHEFGHSLGLSHSSVQGALMFPWYQGLKPDFDLPEDDKIGIQILYGTKNDRMWGNIPAYRPIYSTTTTTKSLSTSTRTAITKPTTVAPTTTPKRPEVKVIPSPVDDKPHYCNSSFDAVSIIRRDTFFFKGRYTWRLGPKGLYPGYPALTNRLWYNLPNDLEQVDAVYERQDGKIVFFVGRQYYIYNGNIPVTGYPKPLTDLGLPDQLDHVDAVTVWGHNSKTYIFSGTMYWRFDDEAGKVELDYPYDMSIWRGIGYNIDAAFQWHDGATYFFKKREYWKFNDLRMRVEQEEPLPIGPFWFNCSTTIEYQPKYPKKKNREYFANGNPKTNGIWQQTSIVKTNSAIKDCGGIISLFFAFAIIAWSSKFQSYF